MPSSYGSMTNGSSRRFYRATIKQSTQLYSIKKAELKVFLSKSAIPIDTNHLERALRITLMGWKNHLFCWTELGTEQFGMLQSLIVTCSLQGINPYTYTYLVDALQRVSQQSVSQVEELAP